MHNERPKAVIFHTERRIDDAVNVVLSALK